jgi:hypothetical protein
VVFRIVVGGVEGRGDTRCHPKRLTQDETPYRKL